MSCLYAPGLECSSKAWPLRTEGSGAWVSLSGKATWRPSSWIGWRSRSWIRLLSGTISSQSRALICVEEWISSLPASLASPTAMQATSKAPTMNETSGLPSETSCATWVRATSSWRMSRALFDIPMDSCGGLETWPTSGSMRSGTCFRRKESEPLIVGAGCSSSRGEHPTPAASAYGRNKGGGNPEGPERPSLETMARAGDLPGHPKGALNPEWPEQAMGWPTGATGFELSATEWTRWLRLMRSELSRLEQ